MASGCAVLAEVTTMPSALQGSNQLSPCMYTRSHPCSEASTHFYRPNSLFCASAHKHNILYYACIYTHTHHYSIFVFFQSGIFGHWADIAPYHSLLTNPLVVSQTCVLCFNRGENKHIVEQGFGTAQVCCWIWGCSITARASQRCLGLGLICNHREGKERTLSCAIAINNSYTTAIINHQ